MNRSVGHEIEIRYKGKRIPLKNKILEIQDKEQLHLPQSLTIFMIMPSLNPMASTGHIS